jgi:hydrogenase maturation protease
MPDRIVVLGIGNILNRDEGVGVHAVRALQVHLPPSPDGSLSPQERASGAEVEFLDGGTLGLNLLPIVEEASHLLILDAVDARQPPGAVVELAGDEIPLFSGIKLSQHQVTFQEVLGLAAVRGKLPSHLHLIGVQPADLAVGLELSPVVAGALPEVMHRAAAVLGAWQSLP